MRAILIEDNAQVAALTDFLLTDLGHDVTPFASGTDALRFLQGGSSYDLIVSNFHLGDTPALDLFAAIHIPGGVGLTVYSGGDLDAVVTQYRGGSLVFKALHAGTVGNGY